MVVPLVITYHDDITPTWVSITPALLQAYRNTNDPKKREIILQEFLNMARIADRKE